MVLAPHREGGQAQFIEQPATEDRRDTLLGALLADLRTNLMQDMSIDTLAGRVAMSRRTSTRRFDKATGMSVAKWIDAERLRKAKDLLETTRMPIDRVAEATGFRTPVSFRQAFKRAMLVSPSEWRRSFGGSENTRCGKEFARLLLRASDRRSLCAAERELNAQTGGD